MELGSGTLGTVTQGWPSSWSCIRARWCLQMEKEVEGTKMRDRMQFGRSTWWQDAGFFFISMAAFCFSNRFCVGKSNFPPGE